MSLLHSITRSPAVTAARAAPAATSAKNGLAMSSTSWPMMRLLPARSEPGGLAAHVPEPLDRGLDPVPSLRRHQVRAVDRVRNSANGHAGILRYVLNAYDPGHLTMIAIP